MHQDAIADFEVGAIPEARIREYDEMCLVQEPKPARLSDHPLQEKWSDKAEQPAEIERTIPAIA
jgi:hypothetical protein